MGPKKRGVKKVENTPKHQKSKSAGCGKPKSSPNTKLNLSELEFACSDLDYELNNEFSTIQQNLKKSSENKPTTIELPMSEINKSRWIFLFKLKTSSYFLTTSKYYNVIIDVEIRTENEL